MHAYLIIGSSEERIAYSEKLAKKLKAKIWEFPLAKIDDTRALKTFTALKVTSPTAIYINSIENATEEAQNAFLKNLEEAQPNLYYILTASTLGGVLPTIVSRCEVIKLKIKNYKLKIPVNPTLADIDRIKNRKEAIEFVRNLIDCWHFNLLNNPENLKNTAQNLEVAVKTLNNLKANGNVGLQLTNLAINLS